MIWSWKESVGYTIQNENHRFWWKLQIFCLKTRDFDTNCRFWWKSRILMKTNLVLNSETAKTVVFSQNLQILQFLNLKLQHYWLFQSRKRNQGGNIKCASNWLLSRPFDPIFVLCTQLAPFRTIWPNFIIVYPIDSFQDHITWFLYCVPNWLLSNPFDLILSLCKQLTPCKTILPNFIIVYPIDSFQNHITWFLHCVPN